MISLPQDTMMIGEPHTEAYTAPVAPNFGYPPGVTAIDLVPEHMKSYIHPHWSTFPPANPMWHYVLGLVYIFLGVIAVTGRKDFLF